MRARRRVLQANGFLATAAHAVLIRLLVFILICRFAICDVENNATCSAPFLDEAAVPPSFCAILRRVCLHQNELVVFNSLKSDDESRLLTNKTSFRPPIPYLETWRSSWNIPGASNSDAIVGNQEAYTLPVRPASRLEPSPARQRPPAAAFTRCTLPVVLLADWPFNFGEFTAGGAATADLVFRRLGLLPDRNVTLALALPEGLSLMPYHQALLGHLSVRPVTTLERMAADAEAAAYGSGGSAPHVTWSHDGHPHSCFERIMVCKLPATPHSSPLETAAVVGEHLDSPDGGGPLPLDPLGFGADTDLAESARGRGRGLGRSRSRGRGGIAGAPEVSLPPPPPPPIDDYGTLRVAIEARHGGARTIRNLRQLVRACNRAAWDMVGSFRRVVCRSLITADTPDLYGIDRFRTTVAAVRSAHVLVAVHGAGAANAFFLRGDHRTAAALLEVRPCGFGSGFPWWVDVHMAFNLPRLGDQVRFHAYNIEDPSQCSPADWVMDVQAADGAANTRHGKGHEVRDQHLTLRPDGFMAMLRHVAGMLRDPEAYGKAKAANRLHGYALPGEGSPEGRQGGAGAEWGRGGGVVLGPLGMEDWKKRVAEGKAEFLLQPEPEQQQQQRH